MITSNAIRGLLAITVMCVSSAAMGTCYEDVSFFCPTEEVTCEEYCGSTTWNGCDFVTGPKRAEWITTSVESDSGRRNQTAPVQIYCMRAVECENDLWVQCAGDPTKSMCIEYGLGAGLDPIYVQRAFGLSCP